MNNMSDKIVVKGEIKSSKENFRYIGKSNNENQIDNFVNKIIKRVKIKMNLKK